MAGNAAEEASFGLKRRSPGGQARASRSVNISKDIHVSKSITAAAQVIPFSFEKHEVRSLLINDQPWFVAADVCQALSIRNNRDAISRLDDDERGVATTDTPSGQQDVGIINESGLYSLILTSRKAEAKRFKKWVTAEVLPAIRKHGRYADENGMMDSLVGSVIGTSGVLVLDRVIEQKASPIPQGMRRSFKHTMKSRLRNRFNVQRTDLIPGDQFADACNFIAAYVIEGEWLGKEEKSAFAITEPQLAQIGSLLHSVSWVWHRWNQGISQGVAALNPGLYAVTRGHVEEMARLGRVLDRDLASLLESSELYFRLGGMRPQEGKVAF